MVIAILGVLMATVSMSLLGLNQLAQRRADEEEMMTVQSALHFMLMDQQVEPERACSLAPGDPHGVNDMTRFPSDTDHPESTGSGEVPSHQPVQLYPHYLRSQYTHRAYVCAEGGTVKPAG